MQKIGRFTPTGRKLLGPGADLIELEADNGLRHTAVVFHPQYRAHRAINEALDVVRGFLEAPLVAGLVELVDHDRAQGAFVYPTGQSWSVAEVIRSLADNGESGGLRAGLELLYAAGQILSEAAEIGAMSGVYSHGGLTPWRILLKQDGQVLIIGEALPQVEILTFSEDPTQIPREDSFRYCPPERIEFEPENLSSDLFGLALIAFELMTGKPVYDGLVDDIRQQAARGEGSRRLFKHRDQIPDGIRQLLGTALKPNPQDRHPSGGAFLEEVRKLLGSAEARGPSLMEVMEKVAAQGKRVGKALEGGKTQQISEDTRRRLLEELADDGPPQPASPRREAWSPAQGRRGEPAPQPPVAPVVQPTAPPVPIAPEATAEVAQRWGPPGRGRQVRRAPSVLPEAEAPAEAPEAQPPAGNRLADRILARMRGGGEEPSAESEGADQGPRFVPGRARPVRREAAPETPPPVSQAAVEAVESGRVSPVAPPPLTPPPPPVGPVTPPPLTSAPPPVAQSPASSAPTRPPPARASGDVAMPVVETEPARPEPFVPPLPSGVPTVLPPALPAEASRVPGATTFAAAALRRAPDNLLAGRKGSAELYTFQLEPGGKPVRIRLPVKTTAAEAIAFLVGYVIPVRTDLTGRLASWYRLGQEGWLVPPSAPLETVDASKALVIRSVPNQTLFADIEVVGGPAPARFVAPVGTAVPAASLVDHLAAWLELPDGRWRLTRDGRVLEPHAILADEDMDGMPRLQLRLMPGDEVEGA